MTGRAATSPAQTPTSVILTTCPVRLTYLPSPLFSNLNSVFDVPEMISMLNGTSFFTGGGGAIAAGGATTITGRGAAVRVTFTGASSVTGFFGAFENK